VSLFDGAVASLQLHRAKLCQSGLAVRKAHIHPTLERTAQSFYGTLNFACRSVSPAGATSGDVHFGSLILNLIFAALYYIKSR